MFNRAAPLAIFLLLFAADASAQSRQPPQPPAAEAQQATSEPERDTAQTPLLVEVVRTEADEAEAQEQKAGRNAQAWLAGVQIVLGAFTLAGLIFAAQSANAAKISADVAKKALEDLERPYVFVVARSGGIGQGNDNEPDFGSYFLAMSPLTLSNYGRSPAIVRSIHIRGAITDDPSAAVAVDVPEPGKPNWLLLVDKSEPKPWQTKIPCTSAQYVYATKGHGEPVTILLAGRLVYESVIGTRFERCVCWKYVGGDPAWVEHGGADYNYDRKLPHP